MEHASDELIKNSIRNF